MPSTKNVSKMTSALDTAYGVAVDGLPQMKGVQKLAEDYRASRSQEEAANALIRNQVAKAGASGFVTGLGGLITLPASLPANLASVFYIQFRMIGGVAALYDLDLSNDRVKTLAFACLLGSKGRVVLREVGIEAGKKAALTALKKLPGKVLIKINKRVGFRLLTKFGQKGVVNVGKCIPVIGGVISGTVDGASTYGVGKVAKSMFGENAS